METYKDKKGRVWAVKCGCNRTHEEMIDDDDREVMFLPVDGDDYCYVCYNFFYYTTRRAK